MAVLVLCRMDQASTGCTDVRYEAFRFIEVLMYERYRVTLSFMRIPVFNEIVGLECCGHSIHLRGGLLRPRVSNKSVGC